MINIDLHTANTDFYSKWKNELKDIYSIIDFLNSYPDMLISLGMEDFIKTIELEASQRNWINLCSKYTGMEKDFFKPHWVPLNSHGYNYFLDMSDPKYPIFEYTFVFFEPYSYEKILLFASIGELMLQCGKEVDFQELKMNQKDRLLKLYFKKTYEAKQKGL
jgi:hypothetical protein